MAEIQPQKKINSDAEKLKDSLTLPPVPGQRLKWEQWEQYAKLLTEDQSEMIKWYLYRQKPVIIKQKPIYIQEPTFGLPDYDTIIAMHGGGNYRLDIQDGGKQKKITEVFLSVPMSIPPKLNLEELDMNEKGNLGYINQLISDGKITKDGQVISNNPTVQTSQSVPEAMAKQTSEFLNMFMRMNEAQQRQAIEMAAKKDDLGGTVGQILVKKMEQDNPNALIPMLIEMMKQQKSTAGDFTPMITFMGTMMTTVTQMQSKQTEMMLEVMKANKGEKGEDEEGGKSSIDKLKELLEVARMIKGGGSGEPKGTLETIVEGASSVLPSIMQGITAWLQYAAMSKGTPMPMATPPGAPGPNIGQEMPQQLAPPNVVQMPNPKPETQLMTPVNQIIQFLGNPSIGPIVLQHMASSQDNPHPGAMFADLLIGMYGAPVYAAVAKYDVDTIIQSAKQVPPFWQQIEATYGEAHFKQWVEDFKDYEKVIAKMEEEAGEEEEN